MTAWRMGGTAIVLLAVLSPAWGQSVGLAEKVKAGDVFRYQIEMKLKGALKIQRDGKSVEVPLEAKAQHTFAERVLVPGASNTVARAARIYDEARASINVDKKKSERTLRPERRLIVAQREKHRSLVYCPKGPLTRAELDVTGDHFDTRAVAGVLPGEPTKVGGTWKVANPVIQALCNFEGMTENKVEGKLEKLEGPHATFSLTGTAAGIEMGALARIEIKATGQFDTKLGRLVRLVWTQKDQRDGGPASPASQSETTVTVQRQPIAQPAPLSDVALISVPEGFNVPPALQQVEYREGKGRYRLLHAREWLFVGDTGEHAVLRLVERGDFVAQVTVAPWTRAKKGEHLTAEQFQTAMNTTSGWRPEKVLQAGEVSSTAHWTYRYSVLGILDGVNVLQTFYLVAGPDGQQVVLTFTLSPRNAEKLGARDLALVGSIEVPAK